MLQLLPLRPMPLNTAKVLRVLRFMMAHLHLKTMLSQLRAHERALLEGSRGICSGELAAHSPAFCVN